MSIDASFSNINFNCCPICLGDLKTSKNKNLYCSHIFHENCIDEWLKTNNTCPNCRAFISYTTKTYVLYVL